MLVEAISPRDFCIELISTPERRLSYRVILNRTQDAAGCLLNIFLEMPHNLHDCNPLADLAVEDNAACPKVALPVEENDLSVLEKFLILD